jgi:multicomponent K+:H+ antiporter subunit D
MLLLSYGVAMALAPAPILHYTQAAAGQLLAPGALIEQLRATAPQGRQP